MANNLIPEQTRVAWLLPAMGTGGISFQHLLAEFTQHFPQTKVFTGQWSGYALGFENSFEIQEVGATKYIQFAKTTKGYGRGFSIASPAIITHLLKFKPQIVFVNAFSMWTLMALIFKFVGKWQVIIIYEGGSPSFEKSSRSLRLFLRRIMVKLADAFVINSSSGKAYITEVLKANPEKIYCRPFLVPSVKALLQCQDVSTIPDFQSTLSKPIFLYVGQLISRKGIKVLLEACLLLKQKGYENYSLLIVGDGEQRKELESFANDCGLSKQIVWTGKVAYSCLGNYYQQADIFVFPTYEDIWGMVVPEAMAFGKPVICSQGAQASEMIAEGENGFIFNPEQPQKLAEYMSKFLDSETLGATMSEKSRQITLEHTPQKAIASFTEAVWGLTQQIETQTIN